MKQISSQAKIIPGPKGLPFLGSLLDFRKDPLKFLLQVTKDYGDIVRLKLGPETLSVISHPNHLKHIFFDHYKNYEKKSGLWDKLSPLFGQSILTTDGERWRNQRRLAQPAFHHEKIATFANIMGAATEDMLMQWESVYKRGKKLDVHHEMMHLTLRILGKTLLSTDFSREAQKIQEVITLILEDVNTRWKNRFSIPYSIPTPRNRRFLAAIRVLDELVYSLISERENSEAVPCDLLSMLMMAKDEKGEGLSRQQLRDEIITFIFAGHETSANALSWTFALLAQYPEIRQNLQVELSQVLAGRKPNLKDLPQLKLTERVIKESMRLHPPVWFTGRTNIEEDVIDGYLVPAKSVIMPAFYVTHHREDLWEEPNRFNPNRFASELPTHLRHAFFPFGGGPRQCIGHQFAMMEMQIVLASVSQNFSLDFLKETKLVEEPSITLRPRFGLLMELSLVNA